MKLVEGIKKYRNVVSGPPWFCEMRIVPLRTIRTELQWNKKDQFGYIMKMGYSM